MTKSIILAGVGGQGIILAGDIISLVAMENGLDVKKSEVHGMAQRGGSVITTVRFGEKVYSPIIGPGMADIVLSLEKLEGLRNIDYLKEDGIMIVNDYRFDPLPVSSGEMDYPEDVIDRIKSISKKTYIIQGRDIAVQIGNIRVMNMIMLGALSKILPFEKELWLKVIERRVPQKFLEINIKGFNAGYDAMR
uniref:Indolepyruvate oxidoreductase subunit beta n=1 Tax=candidate division WOR-3 bacterium TaxID=2052148 RepID=A0A7C4Y587_UNCW3